jgi:hypothetical protein
MQEQIWEYHGEEITHKKKSVNITNQGGLDGCGMLSIPDCLENRLTNSLLGPEPYALVALVLISVRGCLCPRAMVRLKELSILK